MIYEISKPKDWSQAIEKMTLLSILNPIQERALRQKSATVTVFGKELSQFCAKLVGHLYKENGIGLAAPQMGIFQRIFTLYIEKKRDPIVFINPMIHPRTDTKKIGEEGCLSIPGVYANVSRFSSIDIDAQDAYGKKIHMHLSDIDSICFQHENDHLNGILFIDLLTRNQFKRVNTILKKQNERMNA